RDDTVRAKLIAPVDDGHVGLELSFPLDRKALDHVSFFVPNLDDPLARHPHFVQELGQAVDVVGAKDQVDVLKALPDPFELRLLLHHAAADADDEIGVSLFQLPEHVELAIHPPLGVFPDGAGVVKDEVRLYRRRDLHVTHLREHPEDDLAVVLVHLAAESLDPDALLPRLLLLQAPLELILLDTPDDRQLDHIVHPNPPASMSL